MEISREEGRFNTLYKKLNNNKRGILFFQIASPIFMVLFVGLSFFTFYANITNASPFFKFMMITLMVVLFITLALFDYLINKKEKENKRLDAKIYKLLNL